MSNRNSYMPDRELVDRYLHGEQEAFRLLFDKYWNDLYRIAYRRLPSEDDVKDILQDVFISLWRNLPEISLKDNLGGYLYTSLQNKIFNYYEKKQVKLKIFIEQPFYPFQSENDTYNLLDTKELSLVIKTIIDEMPLRMRKIYLLSKEEQLTNGEIATLLMLAPQTVKNQIHQALCRIRNKLVKSNLFIILYVLFT